MGVPRGGTPVLAAYRPPALLHVTPQILPGLQQLPIPKPYLAEANGCDKICPACQTAWEMGKSQDETVATPQADGRRTSRKVTV